VPRRVTSAPRAMAPILGFKDAIRFDISLFVKIFYEKG